METMERSLQFLEKKLERFDEEEEGGGKGEAVKTPPPPLPPSSAERDEPPDGEFFHRIWYKKVREQARTETHKLAMKRKKKERDEYV